MYCSVGDPDILSFKAHLNEKERQRKQKQARIVKRAKKTPLHHALLNAFSSWNYGVTDGPKRRYAYKPATVVGRFNGGRRSKALCAADLENHWRNNTTLYYMSSGDPKQDRILVKLDFDAKDGVGSYAGCLQAEKHIATKFFHGNVFAEDSTHGTGRHAYVWVYKLGRKAEEVNAALDQLQASIRLELTAINADISGFDLQGTCPVIEWEKVGSKLLMSGFVDGRLAKIPRTATPALLNVTEVSLEDIDRLVGLPITCSSSPPAAPKPKKAPSQQPCYGGKMCEEDFDDQKRLKQLYRRLIDRFNRGECVKAKRRYVVQEEHAAVMFAILRFVFDHPHKDGTFPQARAESLWSDAYSRNLIDCPWNHHRWIALRDFLSKCGFIDWTDNTYFHFFGEAKKGRACKWTVTYGFYAMLAGDRGSGDRTQGGDLGVQRIARGTGQTLYPVLFRQVKDSINPNLFIRAAKALEMLFAA